MCHKQIRELISQKIDLVSYICLWIYLNCFGRVDTAALNGKYKSNSLLPYCRCTNWAIYLDIVSTCLWIGFSIPSHFSCRVVKVYKWCWNARRTKCRTYTHRVYDIFLSAAYWVLRKLRNSICSLSRPNRIVLIHSWCDYW